MGSGYEIKVVLMRCYYRVRGTALVLPQHSGHNGINSITSGISGITMVFCITGITGIIVYRILVSGLLFAYYHIDF